MESGQCGWLLFLIFSLTSDQSLNVKDVGGINLDHYFPYQSSFNTVLYVHKRYCKKPRKVANKEVTEINKQDNGNKEVKEEKNTKCDRKSSMNKKERKNDTVLQQTIKFAKNLVPVVIPPSEDGGNPVYYTVKTCTKCKNVGHVEEKCENVDDPGKTKPAKTISKKIVETFKREKKIHRESYSVESETHSSQCNTLDDININQSLSCTLSELSDKREKLHKNTVNNKRKKRDSNKLHVSESFEGLATELNDIAETKIKIHLMNDKEKYLLSESIRVPVIEAVNDCIKEVDNTEMKENITSIQRLVMNNSQKLDNILERLTFIEHYLASVNSRTPSSPKSKARKPSRLEQLSEDLIDEKEYSSEDELPKPDCNKQNDGITVLHSARRSIKVEELGCGELPQSRPSTSVGVKTDRHRAARFCWTDSSNRD